LNPADASLLKEGEAFWQGTKSLERTRVFTSLAYVFTALA
jgi:hypothetical protein